MIHFKYKNIVFGVLLALLVSSCAKDILRKAETAYNAQEYGRAVTLYEKAMYMKPFDAARKNLAISYTKTNQLDKADSVYRLMMETPNYDNELRFLYGELQCAKGNGNAAEQWYKQYLSNGGTPINTAIGQFCRKLDDGKEKYEVKLTPIKTGQRQAFAPVSAGTNEILFVSQGSKLNPTKAEDFDIYKLIDSTGKDTIVKMPETINSSLDEGPLSISRSGNDIYFTRAVENAKTSLNSENFFTLGIYHATQVNGKWTKAKALSINQKDYSTAHPCLSIDGNRLYFSSDRPGGYGGSDIYVCTKINDSTWSNPENLGPDVNTSYNESYPYEYYNEGYGGLYFSSNKAGGFGGRDIYFSPYQNGKLSKVELLPYPFNSVYDDFSFTLKSNPYLGLLCSTRTEANGEVYGMYNVDWKPKVFIKGRIQNEKGDQKLNNAFVLVKDLDSGTEKGVYADANGAYEVLARAGNEYLLSIKAEGYYGVDYKVSIPKTLASITKDTLLALSPVKILAIEKNIPKRLDNIYYDFDKYELKKGSFKVLDSLIRLMQRNPEIKAELAAHTDSRGVPIYNVWLSQKRADAAVKYITDKGIVAERIIAKGYGSEKLVNKCAKGKRCSKADHAKNRRTEFTIISIGAN